MDTHLLESLDDFVAVKSNPFKDTSAKKKLTFHAAWNNVENKLAVTCLPHSRTVSDKKSEGWGGAFSFHELSSVHEQLCLVHPVLHPYLPTLPYEPRGLWAYFSSVEIPDDNLCTRIENYLQRALDVCGKNLLISTIFEEHSYDQYFENISELKRASYDNEISNADDAFKNVLFRRDNATNMCEMCVVYEEEDEALRKLNTCLAQLYNYLLQPFLDMRELSYGKVREAKNGLQNPDYGERRKKEYSDMFSEWQESYGRAIDSIHDLYIDYYTKTVQLLQATKSRMERDKENFGKASFQIVALDRLNRVLEDLSLERLQLLRAKKKQKEQQRDKIKQEIASLDEKPGLQQDLERLEKSVYDWQVQIYDVSLEILDEEDTLYRRRLDAIFQLKQAKEIEVEFHDAVEDLDELDSDEREDSPTHTVTDPKITSLRNKMASVNRRRAQIRNKRKAFMRTEDIKKLKKIEEKETFKQHHSVHLKREKYKEELAEKQPILQEERKKTLQRLRQYKMKYPTPPTIKPPRYLSNSEKRNQTSAKNSTKKTSMENQTTCIEYSVTPDNKNITVTVDVVQAQTSGHKPTVYTVNGDTCTDKDIPAVPPPPPVAPPPPPPPAAPPLPPPGGSKPKQKVQIENQQSKHVSPTVVDQSSIKDALKKLKKPQVDENQQKKATNPVDDMMQLIRQGVKLRKVNQASSSEATALPSSGHTDKLREVLDRIRRKCADSDEEEEQDFSD